MKLEKTLIPILVSFFAFGLIYTYKPILIESLLDGKILSTDRTIRIYKNGLLCQGCAAFRIAADGEKARFATHIISNPQPRTNEKDHFWDESFGFHLQAGRLGLPSCSNEDQCLWRVGSLLFVNYLAQEFAEWENGVNGLEFDAKPVRIDECWEFLLPGRDPKIQTESREKMRVCHKRDGA
jgi:hypothetical protein